MGAQGEFRVEVKKEIIFESQIRQILRKTCLQSQIH